MGAVAEARSTRSHTRFWKHDGLESQGNDIVKSENKTIKRNQIDFKPTKSQIVKFKRHNHVELKGEKNLKRRRHLQQQQQLNDEAVKRLAASEYLLTETAGYLIAEADEKTFAFKQKDILLSLDVESKSKAFDFHLSGGPYHIEFSRNGRYLLSGGAMGSISILDCHSMTALTELEVQESVRDVCFLQNQTMWAAAQKKYVYIYDHNGIELHCLREHMLTYRMEFLPHHYLLSTIGEFGELRYLDISTGLVAAAHKTKRGPCATMCQNPYTAVLSLGHSRGSVSMWTPNIGKPVVEFLAHGGKVTGITHIDSNYLTTAGLDGSWKIWDIRKFEELHKFNYFGPAPKAIHSSQSGLLGIGFGSHVQFWKDITLLAKPKMPYLTHEVPGASVESLAFRPFEDFCCIGTSKGLQSLVVPGSGLANFHSHSADPYETKNQRQEREVRSLLEKLPAATISFDPEKLGLLDEAPRVVLCTEAEERRLQMEEDRKANRREKNKAKGKSSTSAKEKTQRKQYADLIRKKRERRAKEEKLLGAGNDREKLDTEQGVDDANVSTRLAEEINTSDVNKETSCSITNNQIKCKDALDRFRKRSNAATS